MTLAVITAGGRGENREIDPGVRSYQSSREESPRPGSNQIHRTRRKKQESGLQGPSSEWLDTLSLHVVLQSGPYAGLLQGQWERASLMPAAGFQDAGRLASLKAGSRLSA